ncbi:alpha/beta hydrolase [Halomicroarcula sp. F28]|uniref:alpha/beta fold hydrolase n=1 Tax=Haloarcula salinisoli TaxID=2487746 RepID=UPI001C738CD7|nr:alpha/beta hydrolase [Halomicroarcula salinisoli]MBX0285519.1 alpha/beta hydrolase [Halomicroarcula salinisoli]
MQTVTSTDGTSIAYEDHGDGHPLVLLHGGSATRHAWEPLRRALGPEFRFVVPDRRGRGDSGDAAAYSLAREVADLRAVLDDIDGDVSVFGHSYGAVVALETARETDIDRLVLYEPPVPVGDRDTDDLTGRLREHCVAGDRVGAMKLFYREEVGIPDPERLPVWPDGIDFALADTVLREQAALDAYELPEAPDIDSPVALLTGEQSAPHLRGAAQELETRLPESRLVEVDAGHVGIQSAPDSVAAALSDLGQ